MMAAPQNHQQPLGLGRPSTSATQQPPADLSPLDVDQLTEEQVFGTKKRRYHQAQDPIESSLNTSQLLLSQLTQAPPPPPPAAATPPSATKRPSGTVDGSNGTGGAGGQTAKIPVKSKAKKSKLDFTTGPPPAAASSSALPPPNLASSSSAKRPSPVDDEELDVDQQLGGLGDSGGGGGKKARIDNDEQGPTGEEGGPVGLGDEPRGEKDKRKKVASRAPKRNLLQFLPPPPPPKPSSYALTAPPPPPNTHERSIDSTMPLQISDTPMIRRNQAMRAASSSSQQNQGKRKSSFGKRGNRASASFGEGRVSAPHESIPTEEFYRHVDSELPEAVRMRHLLVFLGKRLSKGKEKEGARESERERLVRETQEEVLKDLLGAKCDTNPAGGTKGRLMLEKPTRPHPGNIENKRAAEQGDSFIKRGKAEESLWSQAVKAANALQTQTCEHLASKKAAPAPELDVEELASQADEQVAELLRSVLGDKAADAVDLEDLEYHIDTIHQVTQTAIQLSQESTNLLDGLFNSLTSLLRTRSIHSHRPPQTVAAQASAAALARGPGSLLVPTSERERRLEQAHKEDARRILKLLAEQEGSKPTLSVRAAYEELSLLPPPPTLEIGLSTTPPPTAAMSLSSSFSGKKSSMAPQTPRKGTATPRKGTGTTPFRSRTPGKGGPTPAK